MDICPAKARLQMLSLHRTKHALSSTERGKKKKEKKTWVKEKNIKLMWEWTETAKEQGISVLLKALLSTWAWSKERLKSDQWLKPNSFLLTLNTMCFGKGQRSYLTSTSKLFVDVIYPVLWLTLTTNHNSNSLLTWNTLSFGKHSYFTSNSKSFHWCQRPWALEHKFHQ